MRYSTVITTALLGVFAIAIPAQNQAASTSTDVTCWNNVIPPTNKAKLLTWLNKKSYKENFIAESAVHPSNGPHGGVVLTYYNPILAGDLYAKKTVFRKGAAMVKELYTGNTVTGYAVMVKTQKHTTAQGQDWLFYETFDTTGKNAVYGKGLSGCAGCHQGGVDHLLSSFRP